MTARGLLLSGLRLPARVGVPGWYSLIVEPAHRALGPSPALVETISYGSRMRLDLNEYTQRRVYHEAFELDVVRFLRRFLRPGDVVIDVGAHVGVFTLLASRLVGERGEVHAFEPVPDTYERLTDNVELAGCRNVTLNRTALGAVPATVTIGLEPVSARVGNTGGYTIDGPVKQVDADMQDLDSYVTSNLADRRVRIVKIDVEGVEATVLQGMRTMLAHGTVDAVIAELNSRMLARHGHDGAAVTDPLIACGYRVARLSRRGRPRPLRTRPFGPEGDPINILAVRDAEQARRAHRRGEHRSRR